MSVPTRVSIALPLAPQSSALPQKSTAWSTIGAGASSHSPHWKCSIGEPCRCRYQLEYQSRYLWHHKARHFHKSRQPGARSELGHRRIPHIGNVVLGNRVDVGTNSSINRATFGTTKLGTSTKVDSMV